MKFPTLPHSIRKQARRRGRERKREREGGSDLEEFSDVQRSGCRVSLVVMGSG